MFIPIPFLYHHDSAADDRREQRLAEESNKVFYANIIKKLANKFHDKWFMFSNPTPDGGSLYMVYKKYPNVFMKLRCSRGVKDFSESISLFKFYVDEKHWQDIIISPFQLYSDYGIDSMIEVAVESYLKSVPDLMVFDKKIIQGKLLVFNGEEYEYVYPYEVESKLCEEICFTVKLDRETEQMKVVDFKPEYSEITKAIMRTICYDNANKFVPYKIDESESETNLSKEVVIGFGIGYVIVLLFMLLGF